MSLQSILTNSKNPLNWYERMKPSQHTENPSLTHLADIYTHGDKRMTSIGNRKEYRPDPAASVFKRDIASFLPQHHTPVYTPSERSFILSHGAPDKTQADIELDDYNQFHAKNPSIRQPVPVSGKDDEHLNAAKKDLADLKALLATVKEGSKAHSDVKAKMEAVMRFKTNTAAKIRRMQKVAKNLKTNAAKNKASPPTVSKPKAPKTRSNSIV